MEKNWNILPVDRAVSAALQKTLNIHPLICDILAQRGIRSYEEARSYFRPGPELLHDPWLMKDMEKAVERIIQAVQQEEKILIFGDYDVDGTTAVACFYSFLKRFHTQLDFYIPHRYREGYGVSKAGIDFASDNRFTLIIALDCGIKSVELIQYAKGLGIDFIVCDHHLPDNELPAATAILNPKQKGCPYPYKELCGCGIGFKLMSALAPQFGLGDDAVFENIDLLATAIAADIVPMTGENRVLAYLGLKKANENPNPGIKALASLSGLRKPLHINNLVFMIAPRINAAGRMDDARKAVDMFITPSYEEAMFFAEKLNTDNKERKEADDSITREALDLIRENQQWENRKSTVVYRPHWHKGVVGIVASRLIEHYYRPTIVLTRSGDIVAGSARSVAGFNLYEAVHACRDHLLGYGGHFAAAGLSLQQDQIESFREKFEEVVSSTILQESLVPQITIDRVISFDDISWPLYNILLQMEPFGPENQRPVFMSEKVSDTGYTKIVKEEHIRFSLRANNKTFTGIGFNMAEKFSLIRSGKPLDIVYKIDENEWNGNKSLQLKMLDFRINKQ